MRSRNPAVLQVTCFTGNDGKQCHDSSTYHHVNTRSVSKNTHVSINPFLSMYFEWVFHLIYNIFAKQKPMLMASLVLCNLYGFICSVINCLTAVEGTDVLETSLYLNSINCLLVKRTFINAFFPRGDAFVMKFANILLVKYFYLFTHVAYLYTILKKKKPVFHW